jgi:hypothetical protein
MNDQTRDIIIAPQSEIAIMEDGDVNTKTINELYRYAGLLLTGGILPKAFDTKEKICTGLLYLKELGLKPMTSFRNLAVINGTPSLWGELPLSLVRRSGLLESIEEFCIDKDYKQLSLENKNLDADIFAAVCRVKRKNAPIKEFFYTKADADKNPNATSAVWKSYRSIMMKRKARSLAIKDEFSDIIGGCGISEYDDDTIPSDNVALPPKLDQTKGRQDEKTAELNAKFNFTKPKSSEPIEEAQVRSQQEVKQ